MEKIERQVNIKYTWWNNGEIPPEHVDTLIESAMERILSQMTEGYTSGQLIDYLPIKGNEDIEYVGHWQVNTINNDK